MLNKKNTRFIAIITLLILPLCNPVVFADEEPLEFDLSSLLEITGIEDLVAKFSKFVYIMKGDEGELTEIIYEYLGKETLDGVEVDKVSMKGSSPTEDQEMLFWLDQEGKTKKVIDNQSGEEIPLMFAGFATMFFFLPFYMADSFDLEEFISEVPEDTEIKVSQDVSERDVGGLPATIYTYNISGYDDDGQEFSIIYEIGDFGDFQIMVSYEMDHTEQEDTFGFWVEEIVLH